MQRKGKVNYLKCSCFDMFLIWDNRAQVVDVHTFPEYMSLSTALYFHTTLHKSIAGVIAVSFWLLTYRVWYTTNSSSSILRPLSPRN